MAHYEHLPIYKKAYDLTLYFEKIVHDFSRYHKYTLGTELRELSREVLRLIRHANDVEEKAPLQLKLRERLEDMKLTIRLCKDLKAFQNFNSFQYSINEVVSLCRQNEGWLKATRCKSLLFARSALNSARSEMFIVTHQTMPQQLRRSDMFGFSSQETRQYQQTTCHSSGVQSVSNMAAGYKHITPNGVVWDARDQF